MKLYRIAGWEKHFEIYDAKRVDGPLKWVAVPTKTDGFGFSRIKLERDSAQLLAAWYLMLGIAAKQDRKDRGKLQRDGVPLTADDMELITGFPHKIFTRAFEFFSQPKQGWLVAEDLPIDAASCAQDVASCAPTRQDKTGQDMTVGPITSAQRRAAGAAPASDSEWLDQLQASEAYRALNVRGEFGKMQAWCGAHKKQPTRRRFVNWLNRAERPMHVRAEVPRRPEEKPPAGWQAALRERYPEARADLQWHELPENIKAALRKSAA